MGVSPPVFHVPFASIFTMTETLLNGRYLLLDAIGSGGEAQVFRARDTSTQCEVAARMAIQWAVPVPSLWPPICHPGWVRLLDSGVDATHGAYQILELLEGPTLGQSVQSGPFDSHAWHDFVCQSLDAVGALHAAGWIHGDLNADNFVHASGIHWKLLELPYLRFGPPSGRSALFGSIHTLAPEQLDGALPDVRSDLYALGCLYYYAAVGEFPHAGATSQQIAIERLRFAPVPLADKGSGLPAASSAWVMTLLEREPQIRFASANEARHLLGVA
jgi:serine/threonine protein kinase